MATQRRVATVLATGEKFLVRRIDFSGVEKVILWGELSSWNHRGGRVLKATFADGRTFLKSAVSIEDLKESEEFEFFSMLWQRKIGNLRAKGHDVHVTAKGNIKDYGTAEQRQANAEMRALVGGASPELRSILRNLERALKR